MSYALASRPQCVAERPNRWRLFPAATATGTFTAEAPIEAPTAGYTLIDTAVELNKMISKPVAPVIRITPELAAPPVTSTIPEGIVLAVAWVVPRAVIPVVTVAGAWPLWMLLMSVTAAWIAASTPE